MDGTERVALITGGNRGLGRSTALALASAGADVVITYRSNADEAADVIEAVEALGRTAVALQLDTSEVTTFDRFVGELQAALKERWGRDSFDFLVNNAGVAARTPIGETSVEAFDLLVDVHFKGVFFLTQSLLPVIADGGRIINVSTGLTRFVGDGLAIYAAVKAAIETLTRYEAQALGPRGITVNAVAPGAIATDFGGGAVRDNEQIRQHLSGLTALGRVGEPEDIGPVIAALLSPGTGWINAQRIEVSGGQQL
jgi:NAD(P)-dependent dehydrogenase (short-subunit alcohol dehydrogenase family)